MKYVGLIKKALWGALAAGIVLGTSIPVYCTNYTSLEEYIEESNKQAEAAGYKTNNYPGLNGSVILGTSGTGEPSSTTNQDEKKATPSQAVKTCDHSYTDSIIKEPTCAESGTMESKCSKCGDTYKTEIPATGKHDYTSEITKEATCTEKGEITYTCTVCGDSYTEEIPAKGHSYVSSVTKEATYTEVGVTTYTCTECGDFYIEEIPALGHTEVEEVTKTAGMFTSGEKVIKCSTCGEILSTEIIPSRYPISVLFIALGIVFVAIIAVSAIFVKMKKGKNNKTSAA